MITVNVPLEVDHFSSPEEILELKEKIYNTFGLPFPDSLQVCLSLSAMNKINHCYTFLLENSIYNIEFYLFYRDHMPIEEKISFSPMVEEIVFDSNLYDDFGDVYFHTFKTTGGRIILTKTEIIFQFLYSNSWTEHLFKFSMQIKDLLALK